MLHLPPGVALPVGTDAIAAIARIGRPIAKVAPWVAGGAIALDMYNNRSVSWGNVYQGVVTGLSLIPTVGWIIGGASLLAEGISYYYTGQDISDNINQSLNGGVIRKW